MQALGAEFDGGDLALLGSFMIEATLPLCVTAGPTATIDSPADGAVYSLFDEVVVDYGCSADAVSCIAWLEPGDSLPTNAIGTFEFRVTAMAEDGTARSSTDAYEVRLPDESVAAFLWGLIDADPDSDLADELEHVVGSISEALEALRAKEPDTQEVAAVPGRRIET